MIDEPNAVARDQIDAVLNRLDESLRRTVDRALCPITEMGGAFGDRFRAVFDSLAESGAERFCEAVCGPSIEAIGDRLESAAHNPLDEICGLSPPRPKGE